MRLKLDENLPTEVLELFSTAAHDVHSVVDENLCGTDDEHLAEVFRAEGRALLTLDRGFGDIRVHPPRQYAGIIVLRVGRQDPEALLPICRGLLRTLETESVEGQLWIVEESGIRRRDGGD